MATNIETALPVPTIPVRNLHAVEIQDDCLCWVDETGLIREIWPGSVQQWNEQHNPQKISRYQVGRSIWSKFQAVVTIPGSREGNAGYYVEKLADCSHAGFLVPAAWITAISDKDGSLNPQY